MRINGAELARILGISRARVSQLVGVGLPRGEDKLFDKIEALRWIEASCFSGGGGDGLKTGRADIAMRATKLLQAEVETPPPKQHRGSARETANPNGTSGKQHGVLLAAPTNPANRRRCAAHRREEPNPAREVLDRILAGRQALPDLLHFVGVRDAALILGIAEIFETVVAGLGGAEFRSVYGWDQPGMVADIPLVAFNLDEVTARLGLTVEDTEATQAQVDEIVDLANEFFEQREASEAR